MNLYDGQKSCAEAIVMPKEARYLQARRIVKSSSPEKLKENTMHANALCSDAKSVEKQIVLDIKAEHSAGAGSSRN